MSKRELIESFCEEYDYDFRGDYSGRFMYGKLCVGIVYDADDDTILNELQDYLLDEDECDFAKHIKDLAHFDSMGLSRIVYFPSIS